MFQQFQLGTRTGGSMRMSKETPMWYAGKNLAVTRTGHADKVVVCGGLANG
jgi:hypothetical protein